ncbi:oligosaccharide flippase family protein [Pseudomonadota bacterium]|nr:oligosaccharide flippase family protein [Pseudomonadota bacterium]
MSLIKNNPLINASTYLGANILNGLIPFLLLPVLTRFLSVEQFGEVAIFQTLFMALSAFVGITIVGAADRKFFDENASDIMAEFIGSCIQIAIFLSCATLLFFLAFQQEAKNILEVPVSYIFYAIFVSVCLVLIQLRLGQWQIRNNAFSYGFFQVSQSALIVIIATILIVFFKYDAFGRIISQVIICGVFAISSIYLLKREGLLDFFHWRPEYILESLKFGLPLVPHVVGVFFLSMADRFLIANELGIAKSGIYMLAAQLATIIWLFFDAANKAFLPWLYEKLSRNELKEKIYIVKMTYAWFGLVLFTTPFAFFIGPYLVIFIAGSEYAEAGKVFGWLALGHSFGGMYAMLNCYIYYSKETSLLSLVTIISGLANIFLLIILIKYWGIVGAGMAFSISMFLRFVLTWIAAQQKHPMPWLSFMQKT